MWEYRIGMGSWRGLPDKSPAPVRIQAYFAALDEEQKTRKSFAPVSIIEVFEDDSRYEWRKA